MREALEPQARFKKLIESIGTGEKICQVTLIGEKASPENALEHESASELTDFAEELGDGVLRSEVMFICALSKLLPCAVRAGRFAERSITKDSGDAAKALRAQMLASDAFLKNLGETLTQLFCESEERLVSAVAGLMDSSGFTLKVLDECEQLLATLAESCRCNIDAGSVKLLSWCPSWQAATGKLMDKENTKLVISMVKNEHYPQLGEASGKLHEMVSLVKAVHKEPGARMVSAEVLREASSAVSTAVETVVLTNVLSRVRVEVPRVKNVHAIRNAVKQIRALIDEKQVIVGDDIIAALAKHEQAETPAPAS
mmetsp:Transcript_27602/g.69850  ORF Transcript_27602/g.69850 Transcript_27602/m.69850 type:complete len:313 (-) Transcript_27602:49-987(-)